MAGAVSANSFKSNFIKSYAGEITDETSDKMKKLFVLKEVEAERIAKEIIGSVEKIVKINDIDNSDFAYAALSQKLERKDGYRELLNPDGTPLNVEKLNVILSKDIEREVYIQKEQKNVEAKVNEQAEKEKLTPEEVKEKLSEIDFEKLSVNDMIFVARNYEEFLKNSTQNERSKYINEFLYGQNEETIKQVLNESNICCKIIRGEVLSDEENKILKELGLTLEEYKSKNIQNFYTLSNIVEKCIDNPINVDTIIEKALTDEDFRKFVEEKDFDLNVFVQNALEKDNKEKTNYKNQEPIQNNLNETKISPEDISAEDMENFFDQEFENMLDFAQDLETEEQIQEQEDMEFNFDSGFEELGNMEPEEFEQAFEEEEAQENSIGINELSPEQLEEDLSRVDALNLEEQQKEQEAYKEEIVDEKVTEENKDSINETPTFEVEENPLKKFFSRIYNTITGKNKQALDQPKADIIEGNPKRKEFDQEDVHAYKYDDRRGLVPVGDRFQNTLRITAIKIVDSVKKFADMFKGNKEEAEPKQVNQYIKPKNTMNDLVVNISDEDQVAIGQKAQQDRIIPQNVRVSVGDSIKNVDDEGR